MLALRLTNSLTTSTCPSHAAMWRAVRPSRSMLFTSMPSSSKSSTSLASPLLAMNRSCIVESRFSGTVSSSATCCRRVGSSDDCRPKLKRIPLDSSDDCRRKPNFPLFAADPSDSCREIERFNWPAISIFSISDQNPISTGSCWRIIRTSKFQGNTSSGKGNPCLCVEIRIQKP